MAEHLTLTKATLAAAWVETTNVRMPANMQASLASSETIDQLRQVMLQLMDILGDDDGAAFFTKYTELTSVAVIGPAGGGFIYEQDDEGNFVNTVTGEVLDTEAVQTQLGVASTEGLIDAIIGGLPDEDPGELLELPFIGGRPGPETVLGDRPVFEPQGIDFGGTRVGRFATQERIQGFGDALERGDVRQRYHLGFDWSPASWDGARRVTLKDSLMRAGYLDPDQAAGGAVWAFAEASAMAILADESNGLGVPWNVQLGQVANNPSEAAKRRAKGRAAADRRPFVAPAFLKPDIATLSQAVKQSVRQRLGREPTGLEMGELVSQLGIDYRAEFGAQVTALRSEFAATTRAIETDEPQAAGEVRAVDPSARFAEAFEERFAGEIDVRKRGAALNQRRAIGAATLSMVDSLIGSRR